MGVGVALALWLAIPAGLWLAVWAVRELRR